MEENAGHIFHVSVTYSFRYLWLHIEGHDITENFLKVALNTIHQPTTLRVWAFIEKYCVNKGNNKITEHKGIGPKGKAKI